MKTVEVRLFSSLRKYQSGSANQEALVIQLHNEAKLVDIYAMLKIPQGEIAISMVNGKWEKASYNLQNGDRIGLFPLIAGG